jgi:hypothetical protein
MVFHNRAHVASLQILLGQVLNQNHIGKKLKRHGSPRVYGYQPGNIRSIVSLPNAPKNDPPAAPRRQRRANFESPPVDILFGLGDISGQMLRPQIGFQDTPCLSLISAAGSNRALAEPRRWDGFSK